MSLYDAVVVGSGPNGLAAAILLARHGLGVLVVEAQDQVGGGVRSEALTLPGFLHDSCSAVHPLAAGSPFLSRLPLHEHGLEWVRPPLAVAHPLDGGRCATLQPSLEETVQGLGPDGDPWRALLQEPAVRWAEFAEDALAPLLRWPNHPLRMARFGMHGVRSASALLRSRFQTEEARALMAGCAAHSLLPLERPPSAAVGLVLAAAAHGVGWPLPRGGAARLARAMTDYLVSLGGEVRTGWHVACLEELPRSRAILLDLTPRQILRLAGTRLPRRYRDRLRRYRYGAAAFKVDWALDAPVPWTAPDCGRAATVHVGGPLEEMEMSERAPWQGRLAPRPFVLFVEPTRFDPSRAPEGRSIGWGYCHVPHGWTGKPDRAVDAIEKQLERFAPGFRDRILARSVRGPAELEATNPNLVGGDINGGVPDLAQLVGRPVFSADPYATPVDGLYLCSSSTPPGGGVHGMCGYHAARSVLRRTFGLERVGGRRER